SPAGAAGAPDPEPEATSAPGDRTSTEGARSTSLARADEQPVPRTDAPRRPHPPRRGDLPHRHRRGARPGPLRQGRHRLAVEPAVAAVRRVRRPGADARPRLVAVGRVPRPRDLED